MMLKWVAASLKQSRGKNPAARARRQSRFDIRALQNTQTSGAYDQGRLTTVRDLEKRDRFEPGPNALPIALADGRIVYDNSDKSINVIGGPGTGKTMCIGFPMAAEWLNSAVILDIDAQYARGVIPHRQSMLGNRVYSINPHKLYGLPCMRWNFFQPIIDTLSRGDTHRAQELARDAAQVLVPQDPEGSSSSNAWIDNSARDVVVPSAILYLADQRRLTPSNLYVFLMRPLPEIFDEVFERCNLAFVLRRMYALQSEFAYGGKKQTAWKFEKSNEKLHIFEPGSAYDEATQTSEFDPATLKSGRPITVDIVLDGTRLESAAPYITLMMNMMIEQVAGATGTRQTLFLWDEFSQCPKAPAVIRAIELNRKRGCRFVLFSQSRSTVRNRYGETAQRGFEAMAGTTIWLQPEYEVAKELSEKSGTKTVLTRGARDGKAGASTIGKNTSEVKVPNLSLAAIYFEDDEQTDQIVVEAKGLPGLLVADKPFWWDIYPYAEQLSNAYRDDSNRSAPCLSIDDATALLGLTGHFSEQDVAARSALARERFDPALIDQAVKAVSALL